MTTQEQQALEHCVGSLQFLLAFYVPGQKTLDTEAWKVAVAGAVEAYHEGAALLEWTTTPYRADNGVVRRG